MTSTFSSTESLIDGLLEMRFRLQTGTDAVPGAAFMPESLGDPAPLVFIQHPGTSSKDDYFVREPSRLWARRGWICVGLDAPLHGERKEHDPMRLFRDREQMPAYVEQFADEVTATLDELAARYPVDLGHIGYVGYSMGSMLGVPAVAKDGRFTAAAFCLVGEGGMVGPATGPESAIPGLANTAVRIVGKTGDELIPRDATEALYNALPGERDIVWLPGGHFEIGPDVIDAAGQWMQQHLRLVPGAAATTFGVTYTRRT